MCRGLVKALAGGAVAITLLVTACAPTRSVGAFSDTLEAETRRLEAKYQSRADEPEAIDDPLVALLGGLGSAVEGLVDAVVLNERPGKGRSQQHPTQAQLDATGQFGGNPLGALSAGLIGSLALT